MSRTPPIEALGAIRVLVAASDPLVRAGLSALLGDVGDGEVTVAGEPSSADVALWDAGGDAGELAGRAGELEELALPALALVDDEAAAAAALAAGARGAVLRSGDGAGLWAALVAVRAGHTVLDGAFAPAAALPSGGPAGRRGRAGIDELTAREREVLALLARGLSNRQIAAALDISEHTAKFHASAILAKLGAATRTEAVVTAARLGLIAL
ncbi:MAG TPA: response regulator transcription factor [Kofleriaceae bacterium]|nr:response regulator transcription factor [Kofleriaceae bacterium]